MQNNMAAATDDKLIQYCTSTRTGSSGSPVFDDDFAVVAIHQGAVKNERWDRGGYARQPDPRRPGSKQLEELQWRNQGTSMIAMRNELKTQAPGLLAKMTFLERPLSE